jgi:hypothetical protein
LYNVPKVCEKKGDAHFMQSTANDNEKCQAFKEEVLALCKKYGLSIGHEDTQGGFILINSYDEHFMEWFMDAYVADNFLV